MNCAIVGSLLLGVGIGIVIATSLSAGLRKALYIYSNALYELEAWLIVKGLIQVHDGVLLCNWYLPEFLKYLLHRKPHAFDDNQAPRIGKFRMIYHRSTKRSCPHLVNPDSDPRGSFNRIYIRLRGVL